MQIKKIRTQKRHSISDIVFNIFNYGFLVLLTFACLYPIWHVIIASVSDPTKLIMHKGLLLWPLDFNLDGYKLAFGDNELLIGFKNTMIYCVLGTAVNMVLTCMGAYALSRKNLMLKGVIMSIIVVTMFFSGGLIPWYITVKKLGMSNNIWAMVLPTALNTWNMIILRTGFQSVPTELEEAAIIDGASQARILTDVILPLSKPVLAVIFLYYFVGNWNAWFNASVLLDDRSLYPLQLFLKEILVQNSTSMTSNPTSYGLMENANSYRELVKYCVTVVVTIPILCIYPFLQKYFVKGVYVGSIKG